MPSKGPDTRPGAISKRGGCRSLYEYYLYELMQICCPKMRPQIGAALPIGKRYVIYKPYMREHAAVRASNKFTTATRYKPAGAWVAV